MVLFSYESTPLLVCIIIIPQPAASQNLRKSAILFEKLLIAKLPYYKKKKHGHEKADSVLKGEKLYEHKI